MSALFIPAIQPSSLHHILVVDDTATNRQILAVFLKKLGHTVETVEDGAKAVALFSQKSYDIVMMDVMMPVMDGYEATRRIKALCGERWVPVIFLSALDKDESLVTGLEAGGDDYLPKPINFVVLEAKLRSLSRTLTLRRELEDARRFSQAVMDNQLDAVFTIDRHGLVTSVNPAAVSIFGYAREEMIGCNVSMLMPEPVRSAHDGYVERYVAGGAPNIIGTNGRQVDGLRKDGTTVPLSLGVSEFLDKGQRLFVGVLRDISVQLAAEQKLRDNARVLQTYYEEREAENALAVSIFDQLMKRPGLADPALRYWMNPATHFSGDIAAASRIADGRLYALLADATGHGLGAAISVLPVLTLFYDIVEFSQPLSRIVAKINGQLRGVLPIGRFVACTTVCVDTVRGQLEVWMGGMPTVLLIDPQGKVIQEFRSQNLPLGIDDIDWHSSATETIPLPPQGGQIVMVSDGLVEAQNAAGVQFGFDGLRAALATAPLDGRREAVRSAVFAHLGEELPHDDVTLMLIDLPPAVQAVPSIT